MEYFFNTALLGGLLVAVIAFIWKDNQKRIERGFQDSVQKEFCNERHRVLDEKLNEISADVKQVLIKIAKLNGEK